MKALLLCFGTISGFIINLAKFVIVHVGLVLNISDLANILGCKISSLPLTYLSLPLGIHHKSTSIWNEVFEKVERRLAGSKKLNLSKGGRITLFK